MPAALHYRFSAFRAHISKPVIASKKEPGRDPQLGQTLVVIVVQMREEDMGDALGIHSREVQVLRGSPANVEQQFRVASLNQRRDPEAVREVLRPSGAHQRDAQFRACSMRRQLRQSDRKGDG